MGLSSNVNVYNSCLRILRGRGFELEVSGEPRDDEEYPVNVDWTARKENFYFTADNPIELLGLVAIFDHQKPTDDRSYWWRVEGPDIWTELMEAAFPDAAKNAEQAGTPDQNR